MGSLNRVELIGNLGKNPDVKQLESGNKVATFSLATTDPAYTTSQGVQVEARTEWHNIVAWGGSATIAERFLTKGQQVYIEGKLRTRSYDDKQTGQKRYTTEVVCERIVLLNNGGNREAGSYQQPQQAGQYNTQPYGQQAAGGYAPQQPQYGGYNNGLPTGTDECPY